ncbi:MAG: hypothetical protein R2855_10120 [Thermomicrobiales bacterium]
MLMAISVLGGVAAGFVMRSGWAVVAALLAFLLAYVPVRRGEQGPSVDGIHLDTAFGILGLLVGRGVFVLLGLIPMALGCAYGVRLFAPAGAVWNLAATCSYLDSAAALCSHWIGDLGRCRTCGLGGAPGKRARSQGARMATQQLEASQNW